MHSENTIEIPTLTVSLLPTLTSADVCPLCAGAGFLRLDYPVGHPRFGRPETCPHPSHQVERLNRLAQVSGMLPEEMGRCLDDIKPVEGNAAMLEAARAMLDKPFGWLWIWGGPGNAKSEILIALVNELNARRRGPAVYTKFSQLLDYMRDAFDERKKREDDPDTDLGYIARFRRLRSVKVLAIDEMDKARVTPFMNDFRFDFLDERYRLGITGQAVTLFASNETPATLPDPIWDRVRDGRFKVVHNQAGSARPKMRRTK